MFDPRPNHHGVALPNCLKESTCQADNIVFNALWIHVTFHYPIGSNYNQAFFKTNRTKQTRPAAFGRTSYLHLLITTNTLPLVLASQRTLPLQQT